MKVAIVLVALSAVLAVQCSPVPSLVAPLTLIGAPTPAEIAGNAVSGTIRGPAAAPLIAAPAAITYAAAPGPISIAASHLAIAPGPIALASPLAIAPAHIPAAVDISPVPIARSVIVAAAPAHAPAIIAPAIAAQGSYIAKTRGAVHVAPLEGHANSAASINLEPAPGTI